MVNCRFRTTLSLVSLVYMLPTLSIIRLLTAHRDMVLEETRTDACPFVPVAVSGHIVILTLVHISSVCIRCDHLQ